MSGFDSATPEQQASTLRRTPLVRVAALRPLGDCTSPLLEQRVGLVGNVQNVFACMALKNKTDVNNSLGTPLGYTQESDVLGFNDTA
jgi:hypothetical protein